jgi:hypothetical protein
MMTDRPFLRLSNQWMLGYDNCQWLLMKAERNGVEADLSNPRTRWRAVSFVSSTKAILMRCLGEHGVVPSPEAKGVLDALPGTFKEWIQQRDFQEQRAAE